MTSFRDLHRPGDPLLMINVWDMGTAKMMHKLGAQALATSSAAHAYTLGLPDGGTLDRDAALAHAEQIVSATPLPVQGDFENGFGDDPETCAETVRLAAEIKLAGICIEDTTFPDCGFYEFDLAVERIKAAAAAARALSADFVLTARTDGIMTGHYDTDEAIRRLQAFSDAGADCLYAPLPPDMTALKRIVEATDKPVNALVAGKYCQQDRAAFAAAGVARLSIGSSLARVTHKAIKDAGQAMLGGDFTPLSNGVSGDEIDQFLS
ncbi:2-Methylisocitrate lyase, PEP mutase family [Cognatiyoonia koreensis]|uniref:2-Methylisocitrate lyase, PEP mutase family n=1 Tax=Cognatiyoonia koreensis TaxID=364200 RepID=A0A1I0PID0_9RHOB|nr:isocitrate lyase/phosphoenolpyruvate mutase family protein [Cognatiyoonia koreensis]SEW14156.1 2-Methylisocitrate lyase, PEP mutase family [Cognatiyoonia koreensis]